MNVKDYEYIVEIARQKSLSEAANRLCITQSALTKFLQRVEAQLGTPLFNRIGKRGVPNCASTRWRNSWEPLFLTALENVLF